MSPLKSVLRNCGTAEARVVISFCARGYSCIARRVGGGRNCILATEPGACAGPIIRFCVRVFGGLAQLLDLLVVLVLIAVDVLVEERGQVLCSSLTPTVSIVGVFEPAFVGRLSLLEDV